MTVNTLIYLGGISDYAHLIFFLFAFFSIIASFGLFILSIDEDRVEVYRNLCKKVILCFSMPLFFLFSILCIFYPSATTFYVIAATKAINQTNLPHKVLLLLEKKIDEQLGDKI